MSKFIYNILPFLSKEITNYNAYISLYFLPAISFRVILLHYTIRKTNNNTVIRKRSTHNRICANNTIIPIEISPVPIASILIPGNTLVLFPIDILLPSIKHGLPIYDKIPIFLKKGLYNKALIAHIYFIGCIIFSLNIEFLPTSFSASNTNIFFHLRPNIRF